MSITARVETTLDDQAIYELADLIADRVAARMDEAAKAPNGYLKASAAAEYLGVPKKRIHDLKSMGAIEPDGCDGRTPLYKRETLDAYAKRGLR